MLIPVVHLILYHNTISDHLAYRPRPSTNYVPHDLFNHYSVIISGVSSLFAVLAAVVITVVKCRSTSSEDNVYSLEQKVHTGSFPVHDRKEKMELPVHWVSTATMALPTTTAKIFDELNGKNIHIIRKILVFDTFTFCFKMLGLYLGIRIETLFFNHS